MSGEEVSTIPSVIAYVRGQGVTQAQEAHYISGWGVAWRVLAGNCLPINPGCVESTRFKKTVVIGDWQRCRTLSRSELTWSCLLVWNIGSDVYRTCFQVWFKRKAYCCGCAFSCGLETCRILMFKEPVSIGVGSSGNASR